MDNRENIIRVLIAVVSSCLSVLLTYATAVSTQSKTIAVLTERVERMQELLKEHIDIQYTASSALKDFAVMQKQLDAHTDAIRKLDENLRRHEDVFHERERHE